MLIDAVPADDVWSYGLMYRRTVDSTDVRVQVVRVRTREYSTCSKVTVVLYYCSTISTSIRKKGGVLLCVPPLDSRPHTTVLVLQ